MARWPPHKRVVALRSRSAYLLLIGASCIALGYVVPGYIREQIHAGITRATVWTPESPPDVDARFRRNDSPGDPPQLVSFHFFNVTNVDEVRNGTGKPHLQEVGPFVYRQIREKLDVWWDSEGRVAYKEYVYHTEVPEQTAGDLDAPLFVLNLPLVGVLHNIHALSPGAMRPWLDLLAEAIEVSSDKGRMRGLFTMRTPRELLWGYEDALLASLALLLPWAVPNTSLELVHNMSGPPEAAQLRPTLVNTGRADPLHTWSVVEDKGVPAITSWNCSPVRVHGSDGMQFRPHLTDDDSLTVWAAELFRPATLVVKEWIEVLGLRLLRYWVSRSELGPDPCFFETLVGLSNISSPMAAGPEGAPGKPGTPLFISAPHFCSADASLAAALSGVHCDPPRHLTFLDVEPTTGITMQAFKRLQLSSQIGPVGGTLEPHMDGKLVLPIFWAEETSQVSAPQAAAFRGSLYLMQRLYRELRRWLLAAGALAAGLAVCGLLLLLALGGAVAGRSGPSGAGSGTGGAGFETSPEAHPLLLDLGEGSVDGSPMARDLEGGGAPPGMAAGAPSRAGA